MSSAPRSRDVAYARLGSLLTRLLAARWRSPNAVTFTNQRSLLGTQLFELPGGLS